MDAVGRVSSPAETNARTLLVEIGKFNRRVRDRFGEIETWQSLKDRAKAATSELIVEDSFVSLLVEYVRYADTWRREDVVSWTDRVNAALGRHDKWLRENVLNDAPGRKT